MQIHLQLDHPAAGFIRAAGHPNCPGASDFRARETQGRMRGAKATCGVSHTSGVIHLDGDTISSTCSLSTSASRRDTPALPLSWGCVLWNWWWTLASDSAGPGQCKSHLLPEKRHGLVSQKGSGIKKDAHLGPESGSNLGFSFGLGLESGFSLALGQGLRLSSRVRDIEGLGLGLERAWSESRDHPCGVWSLPSVPESQNDIHSMVASGTSTLPLS